MYSIYCVFFFFFKQKTAYEMRISDWSSDVCSSDLIQGIAGRPVEGELAHRRRHRAAQADEPCRQADGDGVHLREATVDAVVDVEPVVLAEQIGRASCRGRVCQYV